MANYNAIKYDGFSKGSTTLIKTLTASSSGTLDFVDGSSSVVLDSTYKEYLFIFNNIHPATDEAYLTFQGNASGGSGYNETMTTTYFYARQDESGGNTALSYDTGSDLAQATDFHKLSQGIGNDNDQSASGYLHLFNPSSTTFVKHFIARTLHTAGGGSRDCYAAGYGNTTSAVDAIQFKFDSGNIDAGDICLYGIL